jgi:signal peptidase I
MRNRLCQAGSIIAVVIVAAALVGVVLVIGWVSMRAFRRGRKQFAWTVIGTTIAVAGCLVIAGGFAAAYMFRGARIQGRAMEPTLADQERVFVNRFAYKTNAPQRGDIVMLQYPLDPTRLFVKRIVAVGGERVRIDDGQVYVNDVPRDDSFIPPANRSREDWGPQAIPADSYFVMGDRRNNSSDSRHWGFVPRKHIVGRVQYRWWPIDTARGF